MTTDSGIAPCVTPATKDYRALLSLAICKAAIRRSAKAGDYIIGLTSKSIAKREGYPLNSIIYCARVDEKVSGKDYYLHDGQTETSNSCPRIDCIYSHNDASKHYSMVPNETGHTELNMSADIGTYSDDEKKSYKNSWILLSYEFRYFGKNAHKITKAYPRFEKDAAKIGRAHRVYEDKNPVWHELKGLVDDLFRTETSYTQEAMPKKCGRHTSFTQDAMERKRARETSSTQDDRPGKRARCG